MLVLSKVEVPVLSKVEVLVLSQIDLAATSAQLNTSLGDVASARLSVDVAYNCTCINPKSENTLTYF